jgi:signal transduction histidine kinase
MKILKTAKDLISPIRLFVTVIIAIFCVEAVIMILLPLTRKLSTFQTALLDASLLLFIMFPILYFILLKPLRKYLNEYKQLEKMIFSIEEREQRLIGQNLHDSLGQTLTGIAFKTKSIENRLEKNVQISSDELSQITSLVNQSITETKNLAKQLLSLGTEDESLVMALNKLTSDTEKYYGVSCSFQGDEDFRLFDKTTVTHLYRIAQESVTNAIKHGKPNNIIISLTKENDKVLLIIRDDGKGMDLVSGSTQGLGLQIINYRALDIGAEIDIKSELNKGTSIICTFIDRQL